MALLEVDGIDVFYGPIQALRGVSLQVDSGERVALLGANGAGKTTTLRTVSGLLAPKRGAITFDDQKIEGLPAHQVVGMGISHGPEGRALFPTLSVEENLRFGYLPRIRASLGGYRNPFRKAGAAALKLVGTTDLDYEFQLDYVFSYFPRLKERRRQHAGTLSGGEQQMLVVARALMSSPKLLIVDELSLGLAPKVVATLFEIIQDVNEKGTAVLIVEQFVHMALQNTDRAYVLAKGEVVLEGKSEDFLGSPDLVAAYLGGGEDRAPTPPEAPPAQPPPVPLSRLEYAFRPNGYQGHAPSPNGSAPMRPARAADGGR